MFISENGARTAGIAAVRAGKARTFKVKFTTMYDRDTREVVAGYRLILF